MIVLYAIVSLSIRPAAFGPLFSPSLQTAGCGVGYARAKDAGQVGLMRLANLPDAQMEIAVNRRGVDGCPAPLIVRYNVSK
jgi:hypothetical protein